MKTRQFSAILILFVLFFATACDKIEPPYKETGGNTGGEIKTQKVLLEDYTGHTCVNCPPAAKTASDLKAVYGDQLIIMAVHAGFFATPLAVPFDTDFRSEAGDAWNSFFGIVSNPKGMVNRMSQGGSQLVDFGEWGTRIGNLVNAEASAAIKIETTYSESNKKLDVKITSKFLTESTGTYYLQVCLTEDSIIAPQRNNVENIGPVPTIENYVHRHVLRQGINGSWGESVVPDNGSVVVGNEYEHNYSITLNSDYNPAHCAVVAFIYNNDDHSILQVEEAHIE